MQPPRKIDGATVLEWAWSDVPFGYVGGDAGPAIHGLALCQYEGSFKVYRFSCNVNWETQQDMDYASLDEARSMLPAQYRRVRVSWHSTLR